MCKKLILLTSFVLALSLVGTNILLGEVIEQRISTGSDDAEEAVNDGFQDTYNTSSDLEILDDDSDNGGRQFIGMNFRDIGIPAGSQINNAYIEFVVDELKAGTEDDAFLLLWGHLAANPDGFADPTRAMISDRSRTEAKVPWEPEPWTAAGQVSQTSDISAIIQEIIQKRASEPTPANGAIYSDTWVSLSWTLGWASGNALEIIISEDTSKGEFTGTRTAESYNGSADEAPLLHVEFTAGVETVVSNDVYFSDNFDDVSSGAESAFLGNQASTFLVVGFPGMPFPDGLAPGATYYWRVDLVEPDGTTKHTGPVWSFRIPPKTAYNPDPADGTESVDVDVQLSWTEGFGAKLHTVYFGDNFDDVDNATGSLPQGALNYDPGTLKMAKTYYWRVDEFDIVETHKGDIWSFTTEGAVESLDPANGAVDVTQTPVLTWTPGLGASHEVYFGTDASSLELKGSGNLGSESYDAGQLEWDTTYYWRVDEANGTNADSPWTGPLWSFTTANFLIIDDFESYNDLDPADPASNRIFNVWLDGFDNPALNGSVVGNANPPFAEQTIVHSGSQSMPFAYDNAVGKSEATLTLTSNSDWTVNGVSSLTIWYRGNSANAAEPMYVVLNGTAVVTNDNPDAAQSTTWTEWNIDLQAFGMNLANVNSITLGLGNRINPVAGGSGMLYFDDIRLYPPAP